MTVELDGVEGAFSLFQEASRRLQAALDAPGGQLGKPNRDWFRMADYVLRAYCRPDNWPAGTDGPPREAIPLVFAHVIANQLAYLAVGRLPATIRDAIKKGRYEPGPHELADMGRAVAYLAAVRAGFVSDKHPIQTVAKEFAVSRQTVMRWQRDLAFVTPEDFHPKAAPTDRGELLKREMMKAAARYRRDGRSANAIRHRARKKRV